MPIVPVVNQDPTSTPGVQAPNVAPMQNYTPEQLQRTGSTMENAGVREMSTGQSVALRIQEQLDDANVKGAESKFIQSATDILHGDDGYMNKQGVDALNGYDQASQDLVKAKKDVLDSLGNDIQKHMFDRVSQQHLVTIGGQMSMHRAQQRIEYTATQAASRADSMRSMAQNSDIGSEDQNRYIETGAQEVKNALAIRGVPADSDEAQKADRNYRSQITQDNVSRLMEDGKYEDANTLLTAEMKAGNVEGDTGDRLRRAIRGNLQRTENIKAADDIFTPYQDKQLKAADLPVMLEDAGKIENPEQREHVQDLVRAKFNEVRTNQMQQYRDSLNDVVNYKAANGSLRGVDPVKWGQLDAADQADLQKAPAQQTDLDTWLTFITHPETLTTANVQDAYARGLLAKGELKSLTEKAMTIEKKPEYVQEAGGISERIKYFANMNGLLNGQLEPKDKAQYVDFMYKVNNDIDRAKAQNHGKVTSEQVDKIISQELVQRTIAKPGWLWGTNEEKKYNFQLPEGATAIVKSKVDGKYHYTDGARDLGVAE